MSSRILVVLMFFIAFSTWEMRAQQVGGFSFIGRNVHYGVPSDMVIGPDGTRFISYSRGGLWAYRFDGAFWNCIDRYQQDDWHCLDVEIGLDGTLFCAGDWGGLKAFSFNGSTFTLEAELHGGQPQRLRVTPEGTILVADPREGLMAYQYSNGKFERIAVASDGIGVGDVELSATGTIFTANGTAGIRAYSFDGHSFQCNAAVTEMVSGQDICLSSDGRVIVAEDSGGVAVYNYTGSAFSLIAKKDDGGWAKGVSVDEHGTIFVAVVSRGLMAYSLNGESLALKGSINDGFAWPSRTMVDPQGLVYLLDMHEGLFSYHFTGESFIAQSYLHEGGYARDLLIGQGGSVFLANAYGGVRAYQFNGSEFITTAHLDRGGSARQIASNKDDLLAVAYMRQLLVLRYDGYQFSIVAETASDPTDAISALEFGPDGTIYTGSLRGVIRAFRVEGNTLIEKALIEDTTEVPIVSLLVMPDSTLLYTLDMTALPSHENRGRIGLTRYSGLSFESTLYFDYPKLIVALNATKEGLIIVGGHEGMWAYRILGDRLEEVARMQEKPVFDISLCGGNTVFVRHGKTSFSAYRLDGHDFIHAAFADELDMICAIGADCRGTVFLANHLDGLFAYRYDGTANTGSRLQSIPRSIHLHPPHPNPVANTATLDFELEHPCRITMKVIDGLGREVARIIDGAAYAVGRYNVEFNAQYLSSGVYFCRMDAGGDAVIAPILIQR